VTTPQDRLTIEGLRQTVAAQAAEITTLRAALDRQNEIVKWAAKVCEYPRGERDLYAMNNLRAALATAKEAGGG